MPRKPAKKLENTEKEKNSSAQEEALKNDSAKKTSVKAKSTSAKKTSTKKATSKASTKTSKTAKSTSKSKTVSSKKELKTTSKKASTKKTRAKKSTAKKSTSTKSNKALKEIDVDDITSTTDLTHKIEVIEYYDLPYRYNQTIVKVLAQTPTTLFIYWDISDNDRANFVKQYGEDFFNYTKPVLVIHNNTMHYSFEIEIDDFANSWYLHVNDSNCEYTVELGRRPKYYNERRHIDITNNYLYVTSSNVIDSPNDHVLFDKNLKTVYFKDVKTNIITAKDITSVSFLRNMGRIYNLYDLQSDFNKNSWINSDHWQLDLKNPSSSNPGSTFK